MSLYCGINTLEERERRKLGNASVSVILQVLCRSKNYIDSKTSPHISNSYTYHTYTACMPMRDHHVSWCSNMDRGEMEHTSHQLRIQPFHKDSKQTRILKWSLKLR